MNNNTKRINKCANSFCKRGSDFNKYMRKQIQRSNISFSKKEMLDMCKRDYCNPGCKGTVYGSKNTMQPIQKILRKYINKTRKNILKNNFYEKLSNSTIHSLKQQGAISGCGKVGLNPLGI